MKKIAPIIFFAAAAVLFVYVLASNGYIKLRGDFKIPHEAHHVHY